MAFAIIKLNNITAKPTTKPIFIKISRSIKFSPPNLAINYVCFHIHPAQLECKH